MFETEKWDGGDLMQCLGGTVKLGDIVATIPTAELTGERLITPPLAPPLKLRGWVRGGVLDFGLTIFGSKKFSKLPIEFKRALKSLGISSRWVTGKGGTEIAPAAVAKLKLTSEGIDLCLFVVGDVTHIGKTTHVQDADAWSTRDYGRPRRDILAGMLPPKLARMMVNLATPSFSCMRGRGSSIPSAAAARSSWKPRLRQMRHASSAAILMMSTFLIHAKTSRGSFKIIF